MSKTLLYFHTIKHLKFKQILFRLWYKIYHPKVELNRHQRINCRLHLKSPLFIFKSFKIFSEHTITLLNHTVNVKSSIPWNSSYEEKLWIYNLHYFDGLRAREKDQQQQSLRLLERWIDENPPFEGNGWEPFPLSIRIVNIIKYSISFNHQLSEEIINSLYLQAKFLFRTCEYHIMGNHLFENYKALCFAGLYFETSESNVWFKRGLKGLQQEIKEQILSDGGHFELSSMYHCIILEGILDLYSLFYAYGKGNCFQWQAEIIRMLRWLQVMKRNRFEISYFNDASGGVASNPNVLLEHAKSLGFEIPAEEEGLTYLKSSGYLGINTQEIKLIIDIAKIGPDYLPGHGHADTLSFELMINENPLFVNLGTSCYGISKRREFERSTAAHNSIVLSDANSSEVWGGFRVARRATASLVSVEDMEGQYIVCAKHDGYKRLSTPSVHYRKWWLSSSFLEIEDVIDAPTDGWSYLHLHPSCEYIKKNSGGAVIKLKNGRLVKLIIENSFFVIKSRYAKSFGILLSSYTFKIKIPKENNFNRVRVIW